MTVLAINITGHLPVTSKVNRWALTAICSHTFYVFAVPMRENSAENAVQVYLSVIPAHKDGSVTIFSGNGSEFKNKAVDEACDQLGIKRLFSNLFHPQGISRIENVHNFLK